MLQALRREIRAVDERLPVLALKTIAQHRDASVFYWVVKAGARMFTLFGAVAMFLAVVGLYAVKAYVVARRTREIGIRMALGATPEDILALVKEGLGLTAAGLAAGFLIAVGIGQVVGSMLYEVSGFDPWCSPRRRCLLSRVTSRPAVIRIAPVVALRTGIAE